MDTENVPLSNTGQVSALGKALGLNDNPPLLAFLQGFKISKCYGFKSKFGPTMRESPNDLIIKMQVKRDRLVNPFTTDQFTYLSNAKTDKMVAFT